MIFLKKKGKSKSDEEKESVFYVELANRSSIRLNTLEAVKILLRVMHSYEHYKLVKHEKEQIIVKLKSQLKDISSLVAKIKTSLPSVKIKAPAVSATRPKEEVENAMPAQKSKEKVAKEKKVKGVKAKSRQTIDIPKREISELERLESELNSIEQKLGSLG